MSQTISSRIILGCPYEGPHDSEKEWETSVGERGVFQGPHGLLYGVLLVRMFLYAPLQQSTLDWDSIRAAKAVLDQDPHVTGPLTLHLLAYQC